MAHINLINLKHKHSSFLNELYNAIAFYSTLYKNSVLLCDLNIVRDNSQLQTFCEFFLFEPLKKKPTCYKGCNTTGNDHIIINIPKCFMKSMALETGILDHHKMIMNTFSSTFAKSKPKTLY